MKDKYIDNSRDRNYFTMVPNIVIDTSNVYAMSLYLAMKRIAGQNDTCWASIRTLAGHMSVSKSTVEKARDFLLDKGWIRKLPKVAGKMGQLTDVYEIVDIWQENTTYYTELYKGVRHTDASDKGVRGEVKRCPPGSHKEDIIQRRYNIKDIILCQKDSVITLEDLSTDKVKELDQQAINQLDGQTINLSSETEKPKPKDPKDLVKEFASAWELRFRQKYPISYAKDYAISKRLLKLYDFPLLVEMIAKFFKDEDQFLKKNGYSFGIFSVRLPALLCKEETDDSADAVGKRWLANNRKISRN